VVQHMLSGSFQLIVFGVIHRYHHLRGGRLLQIKSVCRALALSEGACAAILRVSVEKRIRVVAEAGAKQRVGAAADRIRGK
jgi:hypothetical protein